MDVLSGLSFVASGLFPKEETKAFEFLPVVKAPAKPGGWGLRELSENFRSKQLFRFKLLDELIGHVFGSGNSAKLKFSTPDCFPALHVCQTERDGD